MIFSTKLTATCRELFVRMPITMSHDPTNNGDPTDQDGSFVQWDADSKDGSWTDWPCCSGCGQRRQAVCPSCENAGDDIPLAEFIAPKTPEIPTDTTTAGTNLPADVLLMCPHCDEAFAAKFYKLCAECGHDFGDGISLEDDFQERESYDPRIMAVTLALGLLTVGFLLYFWLLLRT